MNSDTPVRIRSNEELQRLHDGREGYIYNHFGRVLHKAECVHVKRMTVGTAKTYYARLDEVRERLGGEVNPCPECLPLSAAGSPSIAMAAPPAHEPRVSTAKPVERRGEFEGPDTINGVYAWLDSPLPFDCLDEAQREIRANLRSRLKKLVAQEGEVLHASYAGPRHAASDVENLLLYNIDMDGVSFRRSAAHGVRFEVAPKPLRSAPSGADFSCSYAYRIVPANDGFKHWQAGRELVRFANVEIGGPGGPLLGRTWLALHRADAHVASGALEDFTPFAVRLSVRGEANVSHPAMVKSLIDGTVAAFQGHGDLASLGELARRVGRSLEVSADEVRALLERRERAALGVRKQLLWPWRDVVQWNPGDHLCLAGEVSSDGPAAGLMLSGEITEIAPLTT